MKCSPTVMPSNTSTTTNTSLGVIKAKERIMKSKRKLRFDDSCRKSREKSPPPMTSNTLDKKSIMKMMLRGFMSKEHNVNNYMKRHRLLKKIVDNYSCHPQAYGVFTHLIDSECTYERFIDLENIVNSWNK